MRTAQYHSEYNHEYKSQNILPTPRLYSVGSLVTSLGPEPDPAVWKIYDGIEIADGKVI